MYSLVICAYIFYVYLKVFHFCSVFKECADADEVDASRASEDEVDVEYPSRETTVNEDFYSFTEEDDFNVSEKSAISSAGDEVTKESDAMADRVEQRELDSEKPSETDEKIECSLNELQNNGRGIIEVQRVEYVVETSKQEVHHEEVNKSVLIEKETLIPREPETKEEKLQQQLNESEHFGTLQFSDSESEDESTTKDQLQEEAITVTRQEFVLEENGGSAENEEEIIEKLSEEEEEMIVEALSEEEDLSLVLDTTERFSPLRFSDSESENDGSDGEQEKGIDRNGTDNKTFVELSETKDKEEIKVDASQRHPVSVQVFKTEIVSETKVIRKTVESPLPKESVFTETRSETISVENNNEEIAKYIEEDVSKKNITGTETGEPIASSEEGVSYTSSTNGSSELNHKAVETISFPDISKSSTDVLEDQSEKLDIPSAADSMDVDEGQSEVIHQESKEVEVPEKDIDAGKKESVAEKMEEEMGTSVVDGVVGSKVSVLVEKENMETDETEEKVNAEVESQLEQEAVERAEIGRLDVTPPEDSKEEKTVDLEDGAPATDGTVIKSDIVETRDTQVSKKIEEMIQEVESSPLEESSKLPTRPETPTRKAEEVPETSRVASVRRSRRVSTSSPATPATPRRSRRTSGNTADEPVTPAHKSLSEVAFERVTRSGRKIGQVPTPVTKKRATSPTSNLVLSGRMQRRASAAAEEVQKVTQRLELSTDETEEAPAAVQEPESVSIATHDVLPTPPSSPTTPSTRRRRRQSSGEAEASATKSPSRRSTRQSALDESLGTIQEEAEVSESLEIIAPKSKTTPRKLEGTPTKATPTKSTPTRTRRKSAKQAAGIESLETIKEDAELSTGFVPLVLDEQITGTPSRRTRRSLAGETSRTPGTLTLGEVSETTPETKTPSRTRRRSISKASEATPEVKTPMRTRRQSGASDVSDIAVEAKTPTRRTRKSVTKEVLEVTPEKKTPARTRRQSVSSDVSEAAQEVKTPTRRTRQSVSKELMETVQEAKTPVRTRRQSASSEVSEAASETHVKTRGRRQSISESMTEVVPKAKTPSQKSQQSQSTKSTRRRTIQVLQSEEDSAFEAAHRLISVPSPGSEISQVS